jgi:hypothetical protein
MGGRRKGAKNEEGSKNPSETSNENISILTGSESNATGESTSDPNAVLVSNPEGEGEGNAEVGKFAARGKRYNVTANDIAKGIVEIHGKNGTLPDLYNLIRERHDPEMTDSAIYQRVDKLREEMTKRGRVVPELRHGRKGNSKDFDGMADLFAEVPPAQNAEQVPAQSAELVGAESAK